MSVYGRRILTRVKCVGRRYSSSKFLSPAPLEPACFFLFFAHCEMVALLKSKSLRGKFSLKGQNLSKVWDFRDSQCQKSQFWLRSDLLFPLGSRTFPTFQFPTNTTPCSFFFSHFFNFFFFFSFFVIVRTCLKAFRGAFKPPSGRTDVRRGRKGVAASLYSYQVWEGEAAGGGVRREDEESVERRAEWGG